MQIAAGEVKKEYLFADHPIMFPAAQAAYPISVIAEITDPGSGGLPPGDCRLQNDAIANRLTWKVVTTNPNFSLLWAKVGSLLDVGNYAPDSHFDEIEELGTGYIRAVYPLIGPSSAKSPVGIPLSSDHGRQRLAGFRAQRLRPPGRCRRARRTGFRVDRRGRAPALQPPDGRAT
jgi:hypothetical protein